MSAVPDFGSVELGGAQDAGSAADWADRKSVV